MTDGPTDGVTDGALRLRLVHVRGRPAAGDLIFPATGAGMAEALALGGGRPEGAQWRAANLCRIVRDTAGGWQMLNGSPALVCARNGERLWPCETVALHAGDAVEVGLLRFAVVGDEAGHGEPSGFIAERFDLRDLATAAPMPDSGNMGNGLDVDDLFSRLDGTDDPSDALDARGGLLASLFDEALSEVAEFGESESDSNHIDRTDHPHHAARAEDDAAPPDANALMHALRDEFVRVASDPAALTGRTFWGGDAAPQGESAPTLAALSVKADDYIFMRDVVQTPVAVDVLLDEFDLFGQDMSLEEAPSEDVLRLFAPGSLRKAATRLPSLTRREHHDLSPDSHVQIGHFRPDTNPAE